MRAEIAATARGASVSERLNSHAALWTAASVAAQAVATVLGWITSGVAPRKAALRQKGTVSALFPFVPNQGG